MRSKRHTLPAQYVMILRHPFRHNITANSSTSSTCHAQNTRATPINWGGGYCKMIGMLTTFLGLGLAAYISLQAYGQGGLFSWHPFLMSFGSLFLSAAGIQAVRSRHRVGGMAPKTQRVQVCVLQQQDASERADILQQRFRTK